MEGKKIINIYNDEDIYIKNYPAYTCLQGYIYTSFLRLCRLFGKPTFLGIEGVDKTDCSWELVVEQTGFDQNKKICLEICLWKVGGIITNECWWAVCGHKENVLDIANLLVHYFANETERLSKIKKHTEMTPLYHCGATTIVDRETAESIADHLDNGENYCRRLIYEEKDEIDTSNIAQVYT